jgi:hypothetical protein
VKYKDKLGCCKYYGTKEKSVKIGDSVALDDLSLKPLNN